MAAVRKQVRGVRLVARVMDATLAEMVRVGSERLSIEGVATRAKVNKTTIYRRWPTPAALAREALLHAAEATSSPPDTGTLQGDLSMFAREFRRLVTSPDMQKLIRMRFGSPNRGPLATLTSEMEEKKQARTKAMLCRAAARGELRPGVDPNLLHDVLIGALLYLVVFARKRSSDRRLERAVHLILDGAAGSAPKARRPLRT